MKKSAILFIPLFLITGIALFYAWSDWSGARQLKQSLAMLDAKKETLRIEDFLPTPVPDERNVAAAPIFKEFFESNRLKKNDSRLVKLKDPWRNSDLNMEEGESWLHYNVRELDPSFKGDENAAGEIILKYLAPSDPTLKEISDALQRPDVVWPLDYSIAPYNIQLPLPTPMIRPARMFYLKALAEMATGDSEKAFEDTQTLLAIARACKEPPGLLSELVEAAALFLATEVINHALNEGSWNDSQIATISTELAQFRLLSQYADALRIERTRAFQYSFSKPDDLRETGLLKKSVEERHDFKVGLSEWLYLTLSRLSPSGSDSEDKALLLVTMQRMIDSLGNGDKLSSKEVWDEVQRQKTLKGWAFTRTPVTLLAMPTCARPIKNICQTQTRLNSLSAACAVERYRFANHQLPASLAELVPSFLPSVPTDPITGEPLIYKRVQGMAVSDGQQTSTPGKNIVGMSDAKSSPSAPDDSFVIYGLGWDRKVTSFNASPESLRDWGIIVTPTK